MYNYIVDPKTNRKVKINTKTAKRILNNYIKYLKGGVFKKGIINSYFGNCMGAPAQHNGKDCIYDNNYWVYNSEGKIQILLYLVLNFLI